MTRTEISRSPRLASEMITTSGGPRRPAPPGPTPPRRGRGTGRRRAAGRASLDVAGGVRPGFVLRAGPPRLLRCRCRARTQLAGHRMRASNGSTARPATAQAAARTSTVTGTAADDEAALHRPRVDFVVGRRPGDGAGPSRRLRRRGPGRRPADARQLVPSQLLYALDTDTGQAWWARTEDDPDVHRPVRERGARRAARRLAGPHQSMEGGVGPRGAGRAARPRGRDPLGRRAQGGAARSKCRALRGGARCPARRAGGDRRGRRGSPAGGSPARAGAEAGLGEGPPVGDLPRPAGRSGYRRRSRWWANRQVPTCG